jgi:2-polyprenyl-3-methyl-5-hydroxy-6-metoxy-1,4-benzoquinol methylase
MKGRDVQEFQGYPVMVHRVSFAGRTFELLGLENCEQLLDVPEVVRRFEQNEYLPYWSQLWPAGLLLAGAVAAWPPAGAEPVQVLEIGCGLGLVSLVLTHLGYRVLATDYEKDALAFVAESARRSGLPVLQTRLLDWRRRDLDASFERIVAADVLYEARNLRPVAELIHQHLSQDGFALIADPNRSVADTFDAIAADHGLAVAISGVEYRGGGRAKAIQGRIFRLHHRG